MMSQVKDKNIGASHYTMLASLEVAGKSVPTLFSGVIADRYGMESLFLLGAVLSSLYTVSILAVLITENRKERVGDEKHKCQ